MSSFFTHSSHMPCPDCGASVAHADEQGHVCDPERVLDYLMFQHRGEVGDFEDQLAVYLESPHGRFAQWYAARRRRAV